MLDSGREQVRVPRACQQAESTKRVIPEKTPQITYQTDREELFEQIVHSHEIQSCRVNELTMILVSVPNYLCFVH